MYGKYHCVMSLTTAVARECVVRSDKKNMMHRQNKTVYVTAYVWMK